MKKLSTLLATAIAFIAAMACAEASTVSVIPLRLNLVKSGSAVDLTVVNGDPLPTRFSVRAYKWTQSPSGEMVLTPSDDVIVYPQIFTVDPLDRRVVRVGFTHPMLPVEQTYRVIVSELPSFDEAHATNGIAVLTKFSIPLFIGVPGGEVHPAVQDVALHGAALKFSLAAVGNVHLFPTSLHVVGVDADGKDTFKQSPPAWYVLPDQPRSYSLAIPANACARTQQVHIDATFEGAPPLHASVAPARAC